MKAQRRPAREEEPSEWISLEDFVTIYKVSARTARRMIAEGEISASRLGKRLIRIRRSDADAALKPIPTADAS